MMIYADLPSPLPGLVAPRALERAPRELLDDAADAMQADDAADQRAEGLGDGLATAADVIDGLDEGELHAGGTFDLLSSGQRVTAARVRFARETALVAYVRCDVRRPTEPLDGLAIVGTLLLGGRQTAARYNFTLPFDRPIVIPFSTDAAELRFGATPMVPPGATDAERYDAFEVPPPADGAGWDPERFRVTAFISAGTGAASAGMSRAARILEDTIPPASVARYPVSRSAAYLELSGDARDLSCKVIGTQVRGPYLPQVAIALGAHAFAVEVRNVSTAPKAFALHYYLGL